MGRGATNIDLTPASPDSLNTRQRATLNWHSPLQVLAQILANPTNQVPVQ